MPQIAHLHAVSAWLFVFWTSLFKPLLRPQQCGYGWHPASQRQSPMACRVTPPDLIKLKIHVLPQNDNRGIMVVTCRSRFKITHQRQHHRRGTWWAWVRSPSQDPPAAFCHFKLFWPKVPPWTWLVYRRGDGCVQRAVLNEAVHASQASQVGLWGMDCCEGRHWLCILLWFMFNCAWNDWFIQ